MARLLLPFYGDQNGDRRRPSRPRGHAPIPRCKHGKPCHSSVRSVALCAAFWHCLCLAGGTRWLAGKLFDLLCSSQKIVADGIRRKLKAGRCGKRKRRSIKTEADWRRIYAGLASVFDTASLLLGLEMAALHRYTIFVVLCLLMMELCPLMIKDMPEWKGAAESKMCEDKNEI